MGNFKDSYGKIWICLCCWEYPEWGPQLKKKQPFKAELSKAHWKKSWIFNNVFWSSYSLVIIRRWFLRILNLLYRSLWLGGRSVIRIPFSNGGIKGFLVDDKLALCLFLRFSTKLNFMVRLESVTFFYLTTLRETRLY